MNDMQDRGLAVLRNGYPLIPIRPQDKRPAIDGWRTINPTEELVKGWFGGIGIRTGSIVFIDIDIPNAVADRLRAVCERLFGKAPVRVGNAPKLGLIYRAETVWKTHISRVYRDPREARCAIEALADGRQFVAYGIHPDTLAPYYYLTQATPENTPVGDLVVVAEDQIFELFRQFDAIAAEEGWVGNRATTPGAGTVEGLPINPARLPLGLADDAIMAAVMAIPNDDRFDAREDWLKFGFGIHHETGGSEFGREVFYEWSSQHSSHREELFRKAWDSMGAQNNDANFAAVTFRYILGLGRDLRKAALAKEIARIEDAVNTVKSIDALTRLAFDISSLKELDDIRREIFAGQIQAAAKNLGAKLSLPAIRKLLKTPPGEIAMPNWLKDWVFLAETDQFYDTRRDVYVGPNAFNRAFGHEARGDVASRYATETINIPVHHYTAYLPGKGAVWVDPLEVSWVNTYRDTAPAVPDSYSARDLAAIETVRNHARHLFGPDMERDIALLHSALAYIVQTQKRINWMIVLQGAEAIGKTFYAHLLRAVLGGAPHVYEVTTETLTESNFTSWAEGHLVTYVEELKLHGKRYDVLNKMKSYISNEYVTVHAKYQSPRNVLNTASYFAFTNHRDALPIGEGDTRYFIMLSQWQNSDEVSQFKLENPDYYARLWQTLEDSPGALRRWLLEYDLHREFDPRDRAPASAGKATVLREAKPELQQWAEDLLREGIPGIGNDLVIAHMLREALADESSALPPYEAVSGILKRLQFTPVNAGRIKITDPVTKARRYFYCWSKDKSMISATTAKLRQQIDFILAQRQSSL